MPVKRFRTKIVEIEAVQFTGENFDELQEWTNGGFDPLFDDKYDDPDFMAEVWDFLHQSWIGVKPGQWIVRGAKGEYYPCDDETFHWKYEEVGNHPFMGDKTDEEINEYLKNNIVSPHDAHQLLGKD